MAVAPASAAGATWVVNPGESIQDAIDAASPGDTIEVRAGTYNENINFSKSDLTVTGAGRDVTILEGPYGYHLVIHASGSSFSGFTVQGESTHLGRAAWLGGSGNRIFDNTFAFTGGNFHALEASGLNHTIEGNVFRNNYGFSALNALQLRDSVIRNNEFIENNIGIQIYAQFTGSVAEENLIIARPTGSTGIYFHGALSVDGTVRNNFIQQPGSGGSGIHMNGSWNAIVEGNVIDGRFGSGIGVSGDFRPQNVTIRNNVIVNGHPTAGGAGIGLAGANTVTVTGNRIGCYPVGLSVWVSPGQHSVHHNNFINNGIGARDSSITPPYPQGPSSYDDGVQGNFWSDYETRYPGATNDGTVWNTPYELTVSHSTPAGWAFDNFPLVNGGPIGADCSVPPPPTSEPAVPQQTVTYLGGILAAGDPIGTRDTTTDFSLDGGSTWQPAYLVGGGHPWGIVPGTNSWINCGPTMNSCLNSDALFRVRFVVPDGWFNAEMSFQVIADNAGTLFLNGTQLGPRFLGGGNIPPVSVDASLVTGINELIIRVEDWGGLAGFNYRADITMNAPEPIVTLPPAPVDTTPPTITPTVTGTLGNNGWYTSNVAVTWTVADDESTATTTGCEAQNVTSDTAGVTFTCTATSAGGSASESVTIKRDATAPTISASASPAPNSNGWNNTNVTVSYTANDVPTSTATITFGTGGSTGLSDYSEQGLTVTPIVGAGTISIFGGKLYANTAQTTTHEFEMGGAPFTLLSLEQVPSGAPSRFGTHSFVSSAGGTVVNTLRPTTLTFSGSEWVNITSFTWTITCTDSPCPNDGYLDNVVVALGGSGVDAGASDVGDDVLSADGAGQSASGSVTDLAGNTATATASGINIDQTAPTISATVTGAVGDNGWYVSDVTVSYAALDGGSGIDAGASDLGDDDLTGDGAGQSASGSVTDLAGNTASATASGINIDKTAPTVTAPANQAVTTGDPLGAVVTYSATGSDATSGLASVTSSPASGSVFPVGTTTVTHTATDNAGNTSTTTHTVTVGLVLTIDIKPGSDVNPLNLNGNGVVPVAILGSSVLDVTSIDVSTLTIGGSTPAHGGHIEDVNDDGILDLVVHLTDSGLGIDVATPGGTVLTLTMTGALNNGTAFVGTDDVRINSNNAASKGKGGKGPK